MGKGTSIVLGRTGLYRVQVQVCYLVLMGTAGTTLSRNNLYSTRCNTNSSKYLKSNCIHQQEYILIADSEFRTFRVCGGLTMHEVSNNLARLQGRKCTVSGPLPIQKNLKLRDLNLSCCSDAKFRLLRHGLACEIPSKSHQIRK